jgi:serine protease inhibitor
MKRQLAALLALALTLTGCGGSSGGIALARADMPRASADPALATSAAAAVNAFGLELLARAGSGGGNVVVSPASVALALAMARAGARGETAAQMDAVLRGVGSDQHAGWLNALDAALTSRSGTFPDATGAQLPVALRIANAPFAQRGMTLVPAYLDALAARFGAGLRLVDYKTDTEGARKLINGWVSDQTERRIPELLVPGVLTDATRLTLVNAIYLKAPWLTPFPASATKSGAFSRADGTTVDVPTMAASTELSYAAGTGWRAVELPYVGGSLAMTIIVPDDPAAFEASLTPELLAQLTGALAPRIVNLSLPKFGLESKTDLAAVLGAMGMPLAFDPDRADFSGITTQERLVISAVIHQANIDVDEKGTEAAAATAVVMRATAAPSEPPVTLRVDRPFLFAIRDLPTGAVLFLGRVADPSARS